MYLSSLVATPASPPRIMPRNPSSVTILSSGAPMAPSNALMARGALMAPSTSASKSMSSDIGSPSTTPTAGMAGSRMGHALAFTPNCCLNLLYTSSPPPAHLQPTSVVRSKSSRGLALKQTVHANGLNVVR